MNRCVRSALVAFVLLTVPVSPAAAQGGGPSVPAKAENADLQAIRAASELFVDAFNRGDAKAVGTLWHEDGEYIDEAGRKFSGRAAIEQEYARFLSEHPGNRIKIVMNSLRLLSADAAVEDGRAMLEPAAGGVPTSTAYTVVHIKTNGKWLMSSVRDTRVDTPLDRGLQDLDWLVGNWTAEEHGAKVDAVCRWVVDKKFLQREYSVTHPDRTKTAGLQIIGWNSQLERIQSWNFTSDGGHAVGIWTPLENGWGVELTGTLADGTSTTAVNRLTRLDNNAYAWQSINRTAGNFRLPETDEVVLKRRSDSR